MRPYWLDNCQRLTLMLVLSCDLGGAWIGPITAVILAVAVAPSELATTIQAGVR